MKAAQYWNIDNVKSFRNFDVTNGEVDLSDSEYGDYLDEVYEPVQVAGMTFNVSRIIQELDSVAWRCGKGDYESEIQSELESQLENEDDSDIEFIDDELEDEDDEDEDDEDESDDE